ncbi:hypothetical protein C5167_035481 [Papaver somniferum]|uniref:Uncharacterized protein n=1 Tax=Papaver somniferum TaxID=3469 RepID=A0A4Y7KHH4_PAPSO|nr:hypothetical protein C5167_035481 [Papaver somniferum]
MADFENLLLEAAGRTGSSGRNRHARPPSRRKREGSYSDDGRDSKDDDSDDDRGYISRKASGSHVPLKKRLDVSEKDDERRDDDDYEDHRGGSSEDSDVGSDLYKDEDDREELAKMTELQREMILSDRAIKRDDQQLTERVRAKQSSGKKMRRGRETPQPPLYRVCSSARSAEKGAAKNDALNELRAKRMRHQDPMFFGRWMHPEVERLSAGMLPQAEEYPTWKQVQVVRAKARAIVAAIVEVMGQVEMRAWEVVTRTD